MERPTDTASTRGIASTLGRPPSGWRLTLYTIIFEAETPAGRRFDLAPVLLTN